MNSKPNAVALAVIAEGNPELFMGFTPKEIVASSWEVLHLSALWYRKLAQETNPQGNVAVSSAVLIPKELEQWGTDYAKEALRGGFEGDPHPPEFPRESTAVAVSILIQTATNILRDGSYLFGKTFEESLGDIRGLYAQSLNS